MQLTVISLFAGCGGSSLGYKMAGFKELLAIEWEKNAYDTFKLNFPEIPIWQKDICKITGKEILGFCKIKERQLDVLDGSPPCQGFSTAGKRKVTDCRNSLFKEYTRLLVELKPKVFVMENVSGMAKGKMKGVFIEAIQALKSCGYNVKCKLLNAANYSVPQSRQRLFFIGVRSDLGIEPVFPIPHKKIVTIKDAIGGLPIGETGNHSKEVLYAWSKSRPNQSLRKAYRFVGSFQSCRLNPNSVSPTLIKGQRHWHYLVARKLNDLELKRICSFPDNFILTGSKQEIGSRLGNAVMPLQMKAITEVIRDKILKKAVLSK